MNRREASCYLSQLKQSISGYFQVFPRFLGLVLQLLHPASDSHLHDLQARTIYFFNQTQDSGEHIGILKNSWYRFVNYAVSCGLLCDVQCVGFVGNLLQFRSGEYWLV